VQQGDDTLVRQALAGEMHAFTALIDRYKDAVYGVALNLVSDFDAAEDIAQEAFLKAYLHLRTLDQPTRFGNWLRIIAANQARSYLRQRARLAAHSLAEEPDLAPSVEQQAALQEHEERRQLLERAAIEAIDKLPEENRLPLILHYMGGRTAEQVGTVLGISGAAAKMRLHRARRRLQQEALEMVEETLKQKGPGPEFTDRFRQTQLTVLCADLGGFALRTQDIDAVKVAELLFDYHGEMGDIVQTHGGTLDRCDGSGFTAFFGAPITCENHAMQACTAVLEMREKLATWPESGKPEVELRCGLSSGHALVGDMGSRHRADYTVAGDPVHLADRLQKLCSRFRLSIAIDEQVCEQVKEAMEVRELDRITFPGAADSVTAGELLCPRGALTGGQQRTISLFNQGLTLFKEKKWREALPLFEEAGQGEGDLRDWLSWRYRDRCWIHLEAPHFPGLSRLPKEDMVMLLRHVDQRDLLESFRETDPEVRDGFLRVMSQRVRLYMTEEFDAVDHTGYSKEEIAGKQNKIVDIAGWLAQEGKIDLDLGPQVADHRAVMDRIPPQLAADFNCRESSLAEEGVSIVEAGELPGRRRFPWLEKSLKIVTMGSGVVVTCDSQRLEWAEKNLGNLDRDQLFSAGTLALLQEFVAPDGQFIAGPDLKFVCSKDRLRPVPYTNWLQLELYEEDRIDELRQHTEFQHGLSSTPQPDRPDVLACVARKENQLIALAGTSADSDDFWQIGISVLPEFRGRGIAREVVHELTRAILARGKIPYYSTHVDNLASNNVAIHLGYWPAWTEIYARDLSRT
jgi:RNA polymerase sigma factor (sigma-70 family)